MRGQILTKIAFPWVIALSLYPTPCNPTPLTPNNATYNPQYFYDILIPVRWHPTSSVPFSFFSLFSVAILCSAPLFLYSWPLWHQLFLPATIFGALTSDVVKEKFIEKVARGSFFRLLSKKEAATKHLLTGWTRWHLKPLKLRFTFSKLSVTCASSSYH